MKLFPVFAAGLLAISVVACSKTAISPESTGAQTAGAGGGSGAAGAGAHAGGASGQGGAGGASAGTAGAAGAAGSAGTAGAGGGPAGASGAAGIAGAPSKLAFAPPDIVEFGRTTDCVVPVNWSKDGRMDVVTVHASFASSPEYKSYYDRWRMENGKLTIVTGPISLEQLPSAGYPTGGCATVDLDHDGVVEVATSAAHHWIRADAAPGTTLVGGEAYDLDVDNVWEAPRFSDEGNTLTGRTVESKDGVSWTLGGPAYSLAMPFPYGSPAAGDFDGDGNKDLLLHDMSKTNQVQVVRAATGGPKMLPITTVLEDFFYPIVADMNGDGRADLVGQGKKGYQVAFSDGKGGFTVQALFANSAVGGIAPSDSFTAGDVSGDGLPDLIVDAPEGVYVLESDGPGTWRPVRLAIDWKHADPGLMLGQLHLLRVVDMDGDGKNDLVARRDLSLVAFRNLTPSP